MSASVMSKQSTTESRAGRDWLNGLFPASYRRTDHAWAGWLALIGLVVFPLTASGSEDVSKAALYLILIASAGASRRIWQGMPQRWLFVVAALFAIHMGVSNALAMGSFPYAQTEHWHYSERYLLLFAFLPLAWWLGDDPRGLRRFAALALIGIGLAIVRETSAADWRAFIGLHRAEFGFLNAQHAALWLGTVVLAAGAWVTRALRRERGRRRWVEVGLAMTVLGVAGAMLVITQTRQVWLGMLAAVVVGWLALIASGRCSRGIHVAGGALLSAVVGGFAATVFVSDWLREKLIIDWNRVVAYLDAGAAEHNSSTLNRLIEWRFALEQLTERLWFGAGAASRTTLLRESDLPFRIGEMFGHLHNSYVEMGVAFGLVGVVILPLLLGFLGWRLFGALRRGDVSPLVGAFGLAWLALFAVCNFFESFAMYWTGPPMLALVGAWLYSVSRPGGVAGFAWVDRRRERATRSTP